MSRKVICMVILLFPFFINAQVDKTRVLILGTSHLHQIKGFESFMLDNVIAKLDAFNFDVIGIEKMPGVLLDDIKSRQDTAFDEITEGFGASYIALVDTVQTVKNNSFLEAVKNIQALLKKRNLTIPHRKELLFNYLARTDLPSAALQYLYIDNKSVFTTAFEKYLVDIIESNIDTHNEYYSLAAALAKREGINRLEAIDNLQDEALLLKYYPEFKTDYTNNTTQFNKISRSPVYQKQNHQLNKRQ